MTLRFDWDEDKNRSNRKKHAIWFEEAQTVFDDAAARVFFDDEHSAMKTDLSSLESVLRRVC